MAHLVQSLIDSKEFYSVCLFRIKRDHLWVFLGCHPTEFFCLKRQCRATIPKRALKWVKKEQFQSSLASGLKGSGVERDPNASQGEVCKKKKKLFFVVNKPDDLANHSADAISHWQSNTSSSLIFCDKEAANSRYIHKHTNMLSQSSPCNSNCPATLKLCTIRAKTQKKTISDFTSPCPV